MRYLTVIASFLSLFSTVKANFIVSLKPGVLVTDSMISKAIDYFEIGDYSGLIVEDENVARGLESLEYVDSVEEDSIVVIDDPVAIEVNYQWGLDRIDQPKLPLNKKYKPPQNGDGTYIYVCDTGVRISHNEFEGRVENGYSHYGSTPNDKHGHGTHVMSTVLGKTVGVANKAKGVAVKVLDDSGSGTYTGVIKGIEWSVRDINSKKRCGVISMSLGGGKSSSVNKAVNAAVDAGVNVVVAAGNNNGDACFKSPASAEKAITIGSTTSSDGRSYFSNYGKCVDIFAPGSYILGASNQANNRYRTISGTSMACPHVSGALAILFNSNNCKTKEAKSDIRTLAVKDKIKNMPVNTDNLLLQVQNMGESPPTPRPTRPTKRPTTKRPTRSPTPKPTLPCNSECKVQKTENSCVNHPRCTCDWKQQKGSDCRITPTPKPTPKPTGQPTFNCVKECKQVKNRCMCWYNKKFEGGNCSCQWKKKKCIPR
jgi:subtilisin family serine protease